MFYQSDFSLFKYLIGFTVELNSLGKRNYVCTFHWSPMRSSMYCVRGEGHGFAPRYATDRILYSKSLQGFFLTDNRYLVSKCGKDHLDTITKLH